MGVGLVTLNASKRAGRYAPNLQFDTTRKTGTWFMHAYTAITSEEDGTLFAADDKTMFASTSPTRSKWFQRFLLGVKRRMGVDTQTGRGIEFGTSIGYSGVRGVCVGGDEGPPGAERDS